MASTWGYAEIETHIDGSTLPREIREQAVQAATVGGQAFNRRFRREMRVAGRSASREFGRSLRDLISSILQTSGAVRRLYQGLGALRTGFQNTGRVVSAFATNIRRSVTRSLRNFGDLIRTDSIKTMNELREGAKNLTITLDDLEKTFPGLSRGIRSVARGFTYVRNEVRGFSRTVRETAGRSIETLRDNMKVLRITSKDLQDTFPGLTRAVRATGRAFRATRNEVASWGPDMSQVSPAAQRVGEAFRSLNNRLRNHRTLLRDLRQGNIDFANAMKVLRGETLADIQAADEQSAARERNTQSMRRLVQQNRRVVGGIRSQLSAWKRLPHGLRQAVFWTTLVVTAMGALSVIGSAVGGTIVALITMLTALGAGAAIATFGFAGLFAENAKLNEGAQASLEAFQKLGDAFSDLRNEMANSMFDGMADSINRLTNDLLPALNDEILSFSELAGEQVGRIFDALSSPAGIANFEALLSGMEPIFESLVTAVIGFGDALANILIASLPTAQLFAEAIGEVATQFSEWTSSEAGRERLAEWFQTAETIMPLLVDLLGAAGNAIAQLVTPTTIQGTAQFIESLTNFMPILGELLEVVANLNVFGILAAALEAIGYVLEPIMPVLAEFATILGETLVAGLEALWPGFQALGEALAPVLEVLGILINAILPPLIDVIVEVVENVAAWIDVLAALLEPLIEDEEAVESLGGVVETIFGVIGGVITSTTTIITGVLKAVAALLRGDSADAFKFLEDAVREALEAMGIDFDDLISAASGMVSDVIGFMESMSSGIQSVISGITGFFDGLIGTIQNVINWFGSLFSAASDAESASSSASRSGGFASGGILFGPRRILAGESGPEAIVPLRRTLSQVDPSVRALSAIAQGMEVPRMQNGGVVGGGGRTVNVEDGAIRIEGVSDPYLASKLVVDRITELAVA